MAIQKGLGVDGYARNLLKDIKAWLHTLDEWKVTHIFPEGNAPPDFMTGGGSRGLATEYVMGNLPSELYNLISLDIRGVGIVRKH